MRNPPEFECPIDEVVNCLDKIADDLEATAKEGDIRHMLVRAAAEIVEEAAMLTATYDKFQSMSGPGRA